MSQNLELVKAILPQPDADWSELIRDESGFEQLRATLGPLVTDDFESVMVWPAVNRTYYGRRKDVEPEVELIAAAILTFRDGKVARWEDYADRAAALEAAGLGSDRVPVSSHKPTEENKWQT